MTQVIPRGPLDRIEEDLQAIEAENGCRILFAVESGNRAWGFPSRDSDYDVRFVYSRPVDWYLSLREGRNVIELPIRDALDINGWDIKEALNLLLKPNPVILEWLSSPIRYRWNDEICHALRALALKASFAKACLHHYLHLGETMWRRNIGSAPRVDLKKYFYVVRPALCLRWIREREDTFPPMNLQELMAGLALPQSFVDDVNTMVERKAEASEMGQGPRIEALEEIILDAFSWARLLAPTMPQSKANREEADALFRAIVRSQS